MSVTWPWKVHVLSVCWGARSVKEANATVSNPNILSQSASSMAQCVQREREREREREKEGRGEREKMMHILT